jgi:serine/threonine-protein kinase
VYDVPIEEARKLYPEYEFVRRLTPSVQKAAFQVRREGRDLCLKLIAPGQQMARLEREIAALAAVDHPNVVQFVEYAFSVNRAGVRHFVVEHFIAGIDLAERIQPGVRWTPTDAGKLFAQLLDGLGELRRHNLVHRDLKPTNVRVRPDGSPVIIDLGLARHLGRPDLTRTAEGAALGTPLYFAPEQWSGTKKDIDHRTDLFAIGVLMYEALVGRHPFYSPGTTSLDELQAAVCEKDDHLHTEGFKALPPQWQLLVKKLLERARERRPADAAQAKAIIEKLTSGVAR